MLKTGNKAETLAKLYNASKPQGLGLLHYTPEEMTVAEAQQHIDTGDNCEGAAERALS